MDSGDYCGQVPESFFNETTSQDSCDSGPSLDLSLGSCASLSNASSLPLAFFMSFKLE
eukprot:m.6320 g.6320  ORF g.6320 m.6320 type:complete len:58 (-) comp3819_c0_seq2:3400-3573(-)